MQFEHVSRAILSGRFCGLLASAFVALAIIGFGASVQPAMADEGELRVVIANFASVRKFSQTEAVIEELAELGDPGAAPVLRALSNGDLYVRKDDESVWITSGSGKILKLKDPVTGEDAGEAEKKTLRKVKIKNSLRRSIDTGLSGLTLGADKVLTRTAAAETIFRAADPGAIGALDNAIESETDIGVKRKMIEARASSVLASKDFAPEEIRSAIEALKARGDRQSLSFLRSYAAGAEGELAQAAQSATAQLQRSFALWEIGRHVVYGLSLGSVLLLAAIGLAITFGVMGVINMAHGEMVMIGAYTTFVVQEFIRSSFPQYFDYSLAIALPMAFLAAGLVGFLLERTVIRFLYGRPLETLLATWGISLILQQAVRTIFGPSNREVGNPSFMSGAFEVGQLSVTWNRFWIIVFALSVFAVLMFVLNGTRLGLQMRAVTQNRKMASAMGIRTPWVDAMTFALGSGIAGIAGVALSQIDNVSPNLGQGYIIDSFLVVVFGGVGNLWGALVAAFSLGIFNKLLEPYAGAVLAKIFLLVLVILFIQKRPRGLFALRGRAVEA